MRILPRSLGAALFLIVASLAATRERLERTLARWRNETADPLLDAGRLQRWKDAATRWGTLPKIKAGKSAVVRIPEGELEMLK